MEHPDAEQVDPATIVTAMMTATAWLEEQCACEDEHHEGHVSPVLEMRAHTAGGHEITLIFPPILAAPLLESVQRLFQVFVGEPGNHGPYHIPDTPADIDWKDT